MKPRNREVNIFNMSVLDLLTGALGAFCFLTLALFPSYYKGDQSAGMHGTVPPFGFLDLSSGVPDKAQYCGSVDLKELSSEAGSGNLTSYPIGGRQPGGASNEFFLFAFQPGSYHLAVHITPTTMPCDIVLSLRNPNNNWTQTQHVESGRQNVTFDFNMLATDINSNLWNE
jgi:hypothetical protein